VCGVANHFKNFSPQKKIRVPIPPNSRGYCTYLPKRKFKVQNVKKTMNIYVGLSGVAGAGKDLFFSLLSQKINCSKYSLADSLKKEVSEWCVDHYNIHPLTCSRQEKDLIRPLLVTHGTIKRNKTYGRHWVEKLNKKINKNNLTNSIVIITDIRYDDYPEDEVYWLKEELGGYLVHISLYEEVSTDPLLKEYKPPANEEERRNDPKLKGGADYIVDWKREKDKSHLDHHMENFLEWLKKKHNRHPAYKKAERGGV
jgi:hypothetical protein